MLTKTAPVATSSWNDGRRRDLHTVDGLKSKRGLVEDATRAIRDGLMMMKYRSMLTDSTLWRSPFLLLLVFSALGLAGCVSKPTLEMFQTDERRCCTARSKSLTSLCRLQSHPAQYVSGIPSAAILLSISHPIRCSTRCLANVRARISGPMSAL